MRTPSSTSQLTYSDYLKVPQLLDQQHCLADPPAHDELQFIVVHQVYELWFKLVRHELDAVHDFLRDGSDSAVRNTTRLCRRVQAIFEVLVQQIHVLETMRPADFLAFRGRLNPASGFGSVQFREVETMLGLKDEKLASFTVDDPRHGELMQRLNQDSLADSFYAMLRRRGLDVIAPSEERTPDQERATLETFKTLYDAPDDAPLLYDACEALVEIDEQLILWRRHHVMMVERQIGDKPGTGKGATGDIDGIRYLQTTLVRRAFPDLWSVRTLLTD